MKLLRKTVLFFFTSNVYSTVFAKQFKNKQVKFCFLFLLFVALAGCGAWQKTQAPELPAMLANMQLKKTISGVEANKMIYSMHGKATGPSSNSLIGYYQAEEPKNVLYLTEFKDKDWAQRALDKMVEKMANSNFGFSLPQREKHGSDVVYSCSGMGFSHFFYRHENLLLWLQAEKGKASAALEDLRAHF
jgi:hypothetical protein